MKLVVSILNYRTPDLTIDAISASVEALEQVNGECRIIVVDNDSQDGSEEKLRKALEQQQAKQQWQQVEVHQTGNNGGFGAGNNFAIRYAQQQFPDLEYVYILNSDAFPDKEAIVTLLRFMDENPSYGFAGSYIYGTDGVPHQTTFHFPSALGEFEGAARFGPISKLLKKYQIPCDLPNESCDVDWLAGASLMIRMKTLDEIGLFDETFFLYFEETDLCLRALRKGWLTRYVIESRVAHVGSASTGMGRWKRIPGYWLDSRKHYFIQNHGKAYFAMTTFMRILGGGLFNLRCLLERKDNPDPERFIRDLLRHTFS